jgi:rubrerythrin
MKKTGWIDQVISGEMEKSKGNGKIQIKMLEDLKLDYRKITDSMNLLMNEGKNLAYPQLQSEIDQMVSEKAKHAKILESLVTQLGGKIEESKNQPVISLAKGNFKEIFSLETELNELLTEHANFAEDYGFFEISDNLRTIRNQKAQLNEQLERIIMRINTEI